MSTVISPTEVARIAALARLGLTKTEIAAAASQLQAVLAHFAALQDIETDTVPTTDNIAGLTNVTRPDSVRSEVLGTAADLLAAAPHTQDGQVKVKAVFAS